MELKEELDILKEEIVLKEEELSKYQRHVGSISDEVILYIINTLNSCNFIKIKTMIF